MSSHAQTASVVLVSDIGILLFNLLFKCSFYLTYYFGNFSYPIIYPIVTFTCRKVKNYPVKNSSLELPNNNRGRFSERCYDAA